MAKNSKKRLTNARYPRRNRRWFGLILMAATLIIFGVIVSHFYYLGVVGKVGTKDLNRYRLSQYTKTRTLKAKRGTIYDDQGNVIAEDASTYSLYAVLDHKYVDGKKKLYVQHVDQTAKTLARYIAMSPKAIKARLTAKNKWQVEFGAAGSNLSLAVKQQIQAAKMPGIYFNDAPSRLYPNGVFASHVIGMVQTPNQKSTAQLKGTMGLEKQFNGLLKGKNGTETAQTDAYGYTLPTAKTRIKPAVDGGSVYTTIDSGLQSYLETLMNQVAAKYAPTELSAVLMNPKTGEILAASQRPTFDPATGEGLPKMWRNILVEDGYEPGSVMKIFTLSAAINSGKYRPNEYYPSGSVTIDGSKISDWQTSGWGEIPLSQAFPRSSNTGMVRIEQDMGKTTWQEYLKRFHFAQKTGITLPGEVTGSYDFKSRLSQAITAFGQGINVNAMQMLQGATAVANGGTMVKPRLVSKTVSASGKTTTYGTKVVGHPITKATSRQVLSAMREVVNAPYGTGMAYKMPGVDLAVKTGTAQIANPRGGYLTGTNNYIFSVMGMAPASNPKYMLYVTIKQPQKMTDPAETILASLFKPMMRRALALDNDAASTSEAAADVPQITGDTLEEAQNKLKAVKLNAELVGNGNRIVQQLPQADSKALVNGRVLLLTNGAMTMPDVTGWSKADVLKLAHLTGKKFALNGEGFATAQSLAKGALLTDAKVSIIFKQKSD